ncbi:MAG: UDP-N-acetylmuramoyl-L-alanyl-D-glutamate--2,6-diaminopimelate ligase [Rhodocyclaceae bacterium]|nr:MAG: UDP-N-acetylmuramoyl-L-alanyl-D-glutamate--2,6-diaminopimelate ligase [Rhodocyclaceae bacterium]
MRLGDLLAEHRVGTLKPDSPEISDLFIFGVTDDSRDVRFGYLFCALPGTTENGLVFCSQAAAKGAQAIAVAQGTRDEALGLSEFAREKVVVLRVANVREFYARVAADFHSGRPATIASVTGTNGKTSTVCFLRDLWGEDGHNAVSLGTLGLQSRGTNHSNLEAGLTTDDAKTLHIMLGELERAHGVTHLAMEASSHALDQQRLAGVTFDAAGFTNLTQDHLDYHQSMEAYFQAKMRLFTAHLKADGVAVVNTRDPSGLQVAAAMRAKKIRIISYGEAGSGAELAVLERVPHVQGQMLKLSVFGTTYKVEAPVAGAFQAENILCALGLAVATGVPVDRAIGGIARLSPVPGRLELAAVLGNGAAVYVDYAHTPDALANVLHSVRPHVGAKQKLHVLFGCGGDRDSGKRPTMGRIAEELGDCVWVTDDNPRTEDPDAIRKQVLAGTTGAIFVRNAGPRRDALELALAALRAGDVLVVAGKGHEDYQIVLELDSGGLPLHDTRGRPITKKVPFSDTKVIHELLGNAAQQANPPI